MTEVEKALNTTINNLTKTRAEALLSVRSLGEAIEALQATCSHEWENDGYNGHNGEEHYKCAICNKTD